MGVWGTSGTKPHVFRLPIDLLDIICPYVIACKPTGILQQCYVLNAMDALFFFLFSKFSGDMQLGSHFSLRILLRNDNFGSPNEWSKSLSKLLNSWKGLEKDIHLKSQKYPSLFMTLSGRSNCKKVLMNISPTTVPSERAFSMAGFFLSKLRVSMNYWTTLNNPDSLKTKNWQKYFFG